MTALCTKETDLLPKPYIRTGTRFGSFKGNITFKYKHMLYSHITPRFLFCICYVVVLYLYEKYNVLTLQSAMELHWLLVKQLAEHSVAS